MQKQKLIDAFDMRSSMNEKSITQNNDQNPFNEGEPGDFSVSFHLTYDHSCSTYNFQYLPLKHYQHPIQMDHLMFSLLLERF